MRSSGAVIVLASVMLSSCSYRASLHKYELQDGEYTYREAKGPAEKVYLAVKEDTIIVLKDKTPLPVKQGTDQMFRKGTLDFDVITIPFKYRPSSQGFPRQLTAEANGSIFLGWRVDRFKIIHRSTPAGVKKYQLHKGISFGAFGGMGAATIGPWTTNYQTQDEYAGFVLTRGLAVLVGVNSLTFGVGLGWDYLTDRDKHIWIYQNEPWLGITIGLNLN
jgi:hypothetical protein